MQKLFAGYKLRNYRDRDFEGIVKLHLRAEMWDRTGRCPAFYQLREHFNNPRFSLEKDLIVLEYNGEIAAYIEVAPEKEIGRVILFCLVEPYYRGKGLASLLLKAAIRRAEQIGVEVAQVAVSRGNFAALDALPRLGFVHVRTFFELRCKINWFVEDFLEENKMPLFFRRLLPGEESLLMSLQNRCFSGAWGFNPNSEEDILYALSLNSASYNDIILAYRGNEPVAYCWARTENGGSKGRILMLGVLPEWRGKNISKQVLVASINSLRKRGVKVVELTSDSGNIPACRLYFSTGFKIWSETQWFEKKLK